MNLLQFFYAMRSLNWPLNSHAYAGQNGYEALCQLTKYYNNVVNFIKNKLDEFDN